MFPLWVFSVRPLSIYLASFSVPKWDAGWLKTRVLYLFTAINRLTFDEPTLSSLNFAEKTAAKERFQDWFPKRVHNGVELRKELTYQEKFARTERLKNSPLFYMRRELNKKLQDN